MRPIILTSLIWNLEYIPKIIFVLGPTWFDCDTKLNDEQNTLKKYMSNIFISIQEIFLGLTWIVCYVWLNAAACEILRIQQSPTT